ncbi:hypothetical protein ND486_17955 [Pseudonocardia sp. DR1-2]|uniref:hypothetical protein n=1 Tax=Pseudonocardia sp. DR1-2 TaxID=2951168 RepID=UPI002042E9F5|nr:hypothetical protein [Pseudonocardia sp. DR1-2]MCM3848080.1 hypothetical protein [Pseudonocardia sp. DR1-2]
MHRKGAAGDFLISVNLLPVAAMRELGPVECVPCGGRGELTEARASRVGRDVRLRTVQRLVAAAVLPVAALWLLAWPFLDNAGAYGVIIGWAAGIGLLVLIFLALLTWSFTGSSIPHLDRRPPPGGPMLF